jgi:hypothetical protein
VPSGKITSQGRVFSLARPKGRSVEMDALLNVPEGLLSGLMAQSEISDLLDELYYHGLS